MQVIKRGGLSELLFRGLLLRILSNGIQSVLFVIIWRALFEKNNDGKVDAGNG